MDCEQLLNAIYNDMQTLKNDVSNINTYIAGMSNMSSTVDNIYTHVYATRMEELPTHFAGVNTKLDTSLESISSVALQGVANGQSIALVYNKLSTGDGSISLSLEQIKEFLGLE